VIRDRQASTAFSGTAFVIAPDTIATASFVVAVPADGVEQGSLEFVLSDDFGALQKQIFPVTAVLGEFRAKGNSDYGITLFKVPGLSNAGIKPLNLKSKLPVAGEKIIIPGFIAGRPGKLIQGAITSEEQGKLGYDASTGPGTAGAPILDEGALEVVGVHFGSTKGDKPIAFGEAIAAFGPELLKALEANQNP
jgi:V8-like Glu-specific endopeptidase